MVSEHKSVVEVSVPALDQGEALEEQIGRHVETPLTIDGYTFPNGTRILQVDPQYVLGGHCGGHQLSGYTVRLGVPWTPEVFFQQAAAAKHPLQRPAVAPDSLKLAIHDMLVSGPTRWISDVRKVNRAWEAFKRSDEPLERGLHDALRKRKGGERVFPITKGKAQRRFKKLLLDVKYPDWVVADLMRDGFP